MMTNYPDTPVHQYLLYKQAIENTAARLGVDPVVLAEAAQDGELLHRLISAAINSAQMLAIDAEDYRRMCEFGKAQANEGQVELTQELVRRLQSLKARKAAG